MGKFDSLTKKEEKNTISILVSKDIVEELKKLGERLKVTQSELREQIFLVGLADLRKEVPDEAGSFISTLPPPKRTAS